MSVTVIQKANAVVPNGTGTISFPAPTTLGSVVVMAWAWEYGTGGGFTFTDDAGNTVLSTNPRGFNGANCIVSDVNVASECWIAILQNPDDLSNFCRPMQTITLNMALGVDVSVWIFEVGGLRQRQRFSFGTMYEAQLFTQLTPSFNSGGGIATINPEAVLDTTDPFNKLGTSDPLREYFLISICAPSLMTGTPSISAVSAGWTLETVHNGLACAWQISPSGYDPVTQKATFTNSDPVKYGSMFEALDAPLGTPPTTGNIRVVKVVNPISSPQSFTFHPDWESVFSLSGGQSHLSPALLPGTYTITEDAVPNWTTTTDVDPTAIVVTAGATITITFTNTYTPPPPPPPGPVCYADGIIPAGAIDGVNTSFTLPSTPNPPGSLLLEADTNVLAPGVGFTLSFVLSGTQLNLVYPPKTSLAAWYRTVCGSQIPPLYKLNPDQAFDDNAFTSTPTAINSTYFTYGFVNAAKAQQNPLLGFHRKRFSEIQMNVNGSGQFIVTTFPNYILNKNLSYNPYAYVVPPIILQTDPPDDLIRPLNCVGNRVYVMFQTNAVGAAFDISKTIMVGVMDAYNVVNPNV